MSMAGFLFVGSEPKRLSRALLVTHCKEQDVVPRVNVLENTPPPPPM
jgi:hypothetical protein